MTASILYCSKCKEYTLKETHSCGEKTVTVKPAKYSPGDRWGKYRRAYKKEHKVL